MRQPIHYKHEGETNIIVADTKVAGPSTYNDAMNNSDKDKWNETMNLCIPTLSGNLLVHLKILGPCGANGFSIKRKVMIEKQRLSKID